MDTTNSAGSFTVHTPTVLFLTVQSFKNEIIFFTTLQCSAKNAQIKQEDIVFNIFIWQEWAWDLSNINICVWHETSKNWNISVHDCCERLLWGQPPSYWKLQWVVITGNAACRELVLNQELVPHCPIQTDSLQAGLASQLSSQHQRTAKKKTKVTEHSVCSYWTDAWNYGCRNNQFVQHKL